MAKEMKGFSNYRVKILLDLVKILQIVFFFGVCRVKILLYVVKILWIGFFDTLYFLKQGGIELF